MSDKEIPCTDMSMRLKEWRLMGHEFLAYRRIGPSVYFSPDEDLDVIAERAVRIEITEPATWIWAVIYERNGDSWWRLTRDLAD